MALSSKLVHKEASKAKMLSALHSVEGVLCEWLCSTRDVLASVTDAASELLLDCRVGSDSESLNISAHLSEWPITLEGEKKPEPCIGVSMSGRSNPGTQEVRMDSFHRAEWLDVSIQYHTLLGACQGAL